MFKLALCFVGFAVTILAVNAHEELENSHPRHHVTIMKINEDESMEHLCDGAILNTRHVITAAHCVFDADLKHLAVLSGSEIEPPAGMPHRDERLFHRIVKIMLPADYVNLPCRAHEHDIAIVKVGRAFDLSYNKLYKQINLPEPSNDYEGYNALLTSHIDGKLGSFGSKVISHELCAKNSTSIITRANVCAVISNDFQTDKAISGSPLVYDNTLVGVMNAPSKCAISSDVKSTFKCVEQDANMRIYTRITTYLEFINKVTNNMLSADIVYRT